MLRLLLISAILFVSVHAQELVVVVSKNFDTNSVDKMTIKRLFLAKTNQLNGQKIKLLEIRSSDYQSAFYKEITGKSISQIHSYWTTLIFRGKGRPPKRVTEIEELKKRMRTENNYLAYIPRAQVDEQMKIIYSVE